MMFTTASPIFLAGRSGEDTLQAGFRCDFDADPAQGPVRLRVTGRTFLRVWLNGAFVHHGPARAPHDHVRVDTVDLTALTHPGRNRLAIETIGYTRKQWWTTGEASFLLAEVEAGGKVLAATGADWTGLDLRQRRSLTENYSHSRISLEIYDLAPDSTAWRTAPLEALAPHPVEVLALDTLAPGGLLPRGMLNPDLSLLRNPTFLGLADLEADPSVEVKPLLYENPEYFAQFPEGFERPAVECEQSRERPFSGVVELPGAATPQPVTVQTGTTDAVALDYDFGQLAASFAGLDIECEQAATVDLVIEEHLTAEGRVPTRVGDSQNSVIRLHLQPGRVRFEAFEPCSIRYVRLIVRGARRFTVHELFLRRYEYPDLRAGAFLCDDGAVNRLYEGSRRTLLANTIDVFLDCPGRERGGWLCDSLFTARAARLMLGDSAVERVMLEDFLLSPSVPEVDGGFPCAYPGQIGLDCHMPTWSIFLLLELCEYYERTGDRELVDRYQPRVERFLASLAAKENKDGLIQDLANLFIDWSAANLPEHLYPISVAVNAQYAFMLERLGALYNRPEWSAKAAPIRARLRATGEAKMGFNGPYFYADSIEYDENGALRARPQVSEAAQYWDFWFNLLNERDDRAQQQMLAREHGLLPERHPINLFLGRSNLFIGQFVRFELLARWGMYERLLRELRHIFGTMLDQGPGTFWENLSNVASLCHGFAAHVGVHLIRDFLGLGLPNAVARTIELAPHPCGLRWAKGAIRAGHGQATLRWALSDERFTLLANIPGDYQASLTVPEEVRGWARLTLNGQPLAAAAAKVEGLSGAIELIALRTEIQ